MNKLKYLPLFLLLLAFNCTAETRLEQIKIQDFNVENADIKDCVKLLLNGTDVGYIEDFHDADRAKKLTLIGASGTLKKMLDIISSSTGSYYEYNSDLNVLFFRDKKTFNVKLPPFYKSYDGIFESAKTFGATEITLDRASGRLSFKGTKNTSDKISELIQNIDADLFPIEYDIHLFQVDLNNSTNLGVQWNDLSLTSASGNKFGISSNNPSISDEAFSFTGIIPGSRFNLNILVSFLKRYGSLNTLSHPKLVVNNGGVGSIKVGNSTSYVSQVGTTTSVAATTTNVTTDKLETGVSMLISGSMHNEKILTEIRLDISDLIKFNNFVAVGTQLQLPQTTTRNVQTSVNSKSGDAIIIGGLTITREQEDKAGIPLFNLLIPTSKSKASSKSEIVIVLQPKLPEINSRDPYTLPAEKAFI